MSQENTQISILESPGAMALKSDLANKYQKQINNYFNGDEKEGLKFMTSIMQAVEKTPKLLECTRESLMTAFMACAQYGFMPSSVSGEAYVLPYNKKGVPVAQFQLGYQGLVTLFYRAGVRSINSEIVRKNDFFEIENGKFSHKPDPFLSAEDRGEAVGAYVVVETQSGGKIYKTMGRADIMKIGKKFSKSFDTSFSPWKETNDPELWMWKKTVLIQTSKLVPKNESINRAIAMDYADSNISDRLEDAQKESKGLAMGALLTKGEHNEKTNKDEIVYEDVQG